MKKIFFIAIFISLTMPFFTGCSTMSGIEKGTTIDWLNIVADKKGFNNKKYDFCYQLDLKFPDAELYQRIDKYENCIAACCWLSEKPQVVLDLNKNFKQDLYNKGKAFKYTPEKIVISLKYNDFFNLLKATPNPEVIKGDGSLNLKKVLYQDKDRIARIAEEEKILELKKEAELRERQAIIAQEKQLEQIKINALQAEYEQKLVVDYIQRIVGSKIDSYVYRIDKKFKKQGKILLANDRNWQIGKIAEQKYIVKCNVEGELGTSRRTMKSYPIYCGKWNVDLNTEKVKPADSKALEIYNAEL